MTGYSASMPDEAGDAVAVLHDATRWCTDRAGMVKVMVLTHQA